MWRSFGSGSGQEGRLHSLTMGMYSPTSPPSGGRSYCRSTGKALREEHDQGNLAAGHAHCACSTRLKVLVVLMETVDVVRVPAGVSGTFLLKEANGSSLSSYWEE
ncbi:hypothetical protein EYF80_009404 [Liparis tanakae]|uniref:Uncharacterized protein n=1 Tax=Liparis tanakae TaxID=230148 RepID=A0A4Z2IQV6_9TELE|nr:hypothetical protein EYF80_009404 [Liparis tanakae]